MAKSGIKVATQRMGHEGGTTSIGEEIIKIVIRWGIQDFTQRKEEFEKRLIINYMCCQLLLILLVDNYL